MDSRNAHCCVVLMCKGGGGDKKSYQPNRDASQWWNRRDALVRTVSAFLFSSPRENHNSKELVLLFEDDLVRLHMSRTTGPGSNPPMEQAVIALWKRAVGQPGIVHINKSLGLQCKCLQSSTNGEGTSLGSVASTSKSRLPTDSKRRMLSHIQQSCPIEFLQRHRLNATPDVILRKTNKEKLKAVWKDWIQTDRGHHDDYNEKPSSSSQELAPIYDLFLTPTNPNTRIIAGLLHESCDSELPCYGQFLGKQEQNLHIVLFLGAVRDMLPSENDALRQCCEKASIPLVKVRLGSIPEFTSKILTIVSHHHAFGRLGPAMIQLASRGRKRAREASDGADASWPDTSSNPRLHLVCWVPLDASDVTCELNGRSRAIWALVRVLVTTLWRSRLVSKTSALQTQGNEGMEASLTLIFAHRIHQAYTITLSFVSELAEQHRAAPSEHQVLRQLTEKLGSCGMCCETLEQVIRQRAEGGAIGLDLAVVNDDQSIDLSELVYKASSGAETRRKHVVASLCIRGQDANANVASEMFRKCCRKNRVPCISRCSLVPSEQRVEDVEATCSTMLQHFLHQKRLPSVVEQVYEKQSKSDESLTKERSTGAPKKGGSK